MTVVVPNLQQNVPIVDTTTGFASTPFTIWMASVFDQIADQTNLNTAAIASIQANQQSIIALQQQLVAVVQAQNGGSGQSGSASGTFSAAGATFTHGPVVNLTGVAAGNLTYPGTGPNQQNATDVNPSGGQGSFVGAWRIQEIISGVETTVFTGAYAAQRLRDDGSSPFVSILYNTSSTSGSIPRTTTGAISYRLDFNAHDATLGDFVVSAAQLAIYTNRS